ncbi:hypothetical protein EYF80_034092 [Liparis tanakae]|uniref:Uncharacterized protein n=1 Tax=Liparis tanakae TaxID=230148 RepID=A0A4Z2GQ83_9TELE|nr:hypothetical protein EYF80_034092 [Liparis tanakae]
MPNVTYSYTDSHVFLLPLRSSWPQKKLNPSPPHSSRGSQGVESTQVVSGLHPGGRGRVCEYETVSGSRVIDGKQSGADVGTLDSSTPK